MQLHSSMHSTGQHWKQRGFQVIVCQSAEAKTGAIRRHTSLRKHKSGGRQIPKHMTLELVNKVCERGALAQAAQSMLNYERGSQAVNDELLIKFPTGEFRTLCLSPLTKSGLMHPFPDPATWNRHKVELAALVLMLADSGASREYEERLGHIVELALERECYALQKAIQDGEITDEERAKQTKKLVVRRNKIYAQMDNWCHATVNNPYFELIKPVLEQVLDVEPAPLVDNKRDGQRTEMAVSSLLQRELPAGWTLYTQALITSIAGEPFRNQKMVKGEADILVADSNGIVQAILEIKTAKGNPYLALYEDVQRFKNMVHRVRGQLVTFTPGHCLQAGGESRSDMMSIPDMQPSNVSNSGSSSSDTGAGKADDTNHMQTTLRFSKSVKPMYVLGSAISPEELSSVVKSAQIKLLTMELGRVLSTQIDAWKQVKVMRIDENAAILKVTPSSFPQCKSNVRTYFNTLQSCDIFMVETHP